jgi:hypothetical protein
MNADVNAVNNNGWHSLIFSVFGGHLEIIDFLLFETDVEDEKKDFQHVSAKDIAGSLEDKDILSLLSEKEEST